MNWINDEDQNKVTFQDFPGEVDENTGAHDDVNKTALQLSKFKNHATKIKRESFASLLSKFEDLFAQNKLGDISENLLTEDCEVFFFNPKGNMLIFFSTPTKPFTDLYKGLRIIKRSVKETLIDVEKQMASQICDCKIFYEEDDLIKHQFTFDTFSFKDNKINKYRVSFFEVPPEIRDKNLLDQNLKDKMLAKVKEINYAFAGCPDLEKVASLFHENIEYKIWSWDSEKCFAFGKTDFASSFKKLEGKFIIKQIVPFDFNTEGEFVIANYLYYLETNHMVPSKTYIWVATSIYAFDQNVNITKVSQQGELFAEDEFVIPFEVYTKEKVTQISSEWFSNEKANLDVLYNNRIHPACKVVRFAPDEFGGTTIFQGVNNIVKIVMSFVKEEVEWIKVMEVTVDQDDPSYEVALLSICGQISPLIEGRRVIEKTVNVYSLMKLYFEGGKIVKIFEFFNPIIQPIPSPYDNVNFSGYYIKKRKEFFETVEKMELC